METETGSCVFLYGYLCEDETKLLNLREWGHFGWSSNSCRVSIMAHFGLAQNVTVCTENKFLCLVCGASTVLDGPVSKIRSVMLYRCATNEQWHGAVVGLAPPVLNHYSRTQREGYREVGRNGNAKEYVRYHTEPFHSINTICHPSNGFRVRIRFTFGLAFNCDG